MKTATMLTIAGSDSGGGAGIQVDLKTSCALGVFGMTAITAVTVQNTREVRDFMALPPEIVSGQMAAVFDDFCVDAVKVGMVADAAVAAAIREELEKRNAENVVVDPVMVSKSGCQLIHDDAVAQTIRLLPLSVLVTPNIPEAALLAGMGIRTHDDMAEAARRIQALGAPNVLVKGGALDGDADDYLLIGETGRWLNCPRIQTRNTHGTGCTLSAAVACGLALGKPVPEAVDDAKRYVTRAIRDGLPLGHGVGPLGHLADLYRNAGK